MKEVVVLSENQKILMCSTSFFPAYQMLEKSLNDVEKQALKSYSQYTRYIRDGERYFKMLKYSGFVEIQILPLITNNKKNSQEQYIANIIKNKEKRK